MMMMMVVAVVVAMVMMILIQLMSMIGSLVLIMIPNIPPHVAAIASRLDSTKLRAAFLLALLQLLIVITSCFRTATAAPARLTCAIAAPATNAAAAVGADPSEMIIVRGESRRSAAAPLSVERSTSLTLGGPSDPDHRRQAVVGILFGRRRPNPYSKAPSLTSIATTTTAVATISNCRGRFRGRRISGSGIGGASSSGGGGGGGGGRSISTLASSSSGSRLTSAGTLARSSSSTRTSASGLRSKGGRRLSYYSSAAASTGPGSRPPQCISRCGSCRPCMAVRVPVRRRSTPNASEYYPEAWRCKCGGKLYMP